MEPVLEDLTRIFVIKFHQDEDQGQLLLDQELYRAMNDFESISGDQSKST
jgi:hypothetical protein